MSYDLESYYAGKIVAQTAGQSKDDHLQIFLDVELEGKLLDKYNPDGGCDKLDARSVVQVRLNMRDDAQSMEILRSDLEKLGFDGDDIMQLAPESKDHHSFVGKTVFVQPKASSYNGKTSIFWNLRFPRRYQPRLNAEKIDIVSSKARDLWRKSKNSSNTPTNDKEVPF